MKYNKIPPRSLVEIDNLPLRDRPLQYAIALERALRSLPRTAKQENDISRALTGKKRPSPSLADLVNVHNDRFSHYRALRGVLWVRDDSAHGLDDSDELHCEYSSRELRRAILEIVDPSDPLLRNVVPGPVSASSALNGDDAVVTPLIPSLPSKETPLLAAVPNVSPQQKIEQPTTSATQPSTPSTTGVPPAASVPTMAAISRVSDVNPRRADIPSKPGSPRVFYMPPTAIRGDRTNTQARNANTSAQQTRSQSPTPEQNPHQTQRHQITPSRPSQTSWPGSAVICFIVAGVLIQAVFIRAAVKYRLRPAAAVQQPAPVVRSVTTNLPERRTADPPRPSPVPAQPVVQSQSVATPPVHSMPLPPQVFKTTYDNTPRHNLVSRVPVSPTSPPVTKVEPKFEMEELVTNHEWKATIPASGELFDTTAFSLRNSECSIMPLTRFSGQYKLVLRDASYIFRSTATASIIPVDDGPTSFDGGTIKYFLKPDGIQYSLYNSYQLSRVHIKLSVSGDIPSVVFSIQCRS